MVVIFTVTTYTRNFVHKIHAISRITYWLFLWVIDQNIKPVMVGQIHKYYKTKWTSGERRHYVYKWCKASINTSQKTKKKTYKVFLYITQIHLCHVYANWVFGQLILTNASILKTWIVVCLFVCILSRSKPYRPLCVVKV